MGCLYWLGEVRVDVAVELKLLSGGLNLQNVFLDLFEFIVVLVQIPVDIVRVHLAHILCFLFQSL